MHYIPNHLYDMYEPYRTELPVTGRVWKRLVTLPLFPILTDEQVESIVQATLDFSG
jgi:dTDP-4-amino-4,6-dideoxygalactose transaminase